MPLADLPQSSKQHAVPQNIMDVEFKLIGDLTLRQFAYLLICGGISYFSFISAVGIFKWPLTIFFALLGLGLAFVPIQERGLDEWIVNFFKSIFSPTQRVWRKEPTIPSAFLYDSINVVKQEIITLAPTSSRRKLEEYLEYNIVKEETDPLDIPLKSYIQKVSDAYASDYSNTGQGVGAAVSTSNDDDLPEEVYAEPKLEDNFVEPQVQPEESEPENSLQETQLKEPELLADTVTAPVPVENGETKGEIISQKQDSVEIHDVSVSASPEEIVEEASVKPESFEDSRQGQAVEDHIPFKPVIKTIPSKDTSLPGSSLKETKIQPASPVSSVDLSPSTVSGDPISSVQQMTFDLKTHPTQSVSQVQPTAQDEPSSSVQPIPKQPKEDVSPPVGQPVSIQSQSSQPPVSGNPSVSDDKKKPAQEPQMNGKLDKQPKKGVPAPYVQESKIIKHPNRGKSLHTHPRGTTHVGTGTGVSLAPITPDMHAGRRFTNLLPTSGEIVLPIKGEKVLATSNETQIEEEIQEKTRRLQQLLDQIKRSRDYQDLEKEDDMYRSTVRVEPTTDATGSEKVESKKPEKDMQLPNILQKDQPKEDKKDDFSEAHSLIEKLKEENDRLNREIEGLKKSKTDDSSKNSAQAQEQIQKLELLKEKTVSDYQRLQQQIIELQEKLSQKEKYHDPLAEKLTKPVAPSYARVQPMTDKPNVLSGILVDPDGNILEGMLLIVKNDKGEAVRAFKTNSLGQFTLSTPLANGLYTIEVNAEKEGMHFDIVSVQAKGEVLPPIQISGRKI